MSSNLRHFIAIVSASTFVYGCNGSVLDLGSTDAGMRDAGQDVVVIDAYVEEPPPLSRLTSDRHANTIAPIRATADARSLLPRTSLLHFLVSGSSARDRSGLPKVRGSNSV
jgi:hypothetical protein